MTLLRAKKSLQELINPLPQQEKFWREVGCAQGQKPGDGSKYVLYGGARGGGKSYILRWTLVVLIWMWYRYLGLKNVRVGLFCENYPELHDRQIAKIKVEFPEWMGRYVGDLKEFRLSKSFGSGVIALRNLDDPQKYLSAEFAAMAVDELTRNALEIFNTLRGSLRWPKINEPKFIGGTNPGGIGHLWVKSYWMDKVYPTELEPFAHEFKYVPALPQDNYHLPASYIDELKTLPDKLRRAFLEGDWSVFEGQVFEEWSEKHHVLDDFRPPPNWRYAAGLDWGMRNPGCFVLFAMGPEGDVVGIEEFYFKQLYAREAGIAIGQLIQKYPVEYIAADEQMWYQTGVSAPTLAEEFQMGLREVYGKTNPGPALIEAMHGRGSRLAKLQVFRRYLAWKAEEDGEVKPWNRPHVRFTKRCVNTRRTIPALTYEKDGEDVNTDGEDHPYDCVCAFLMSRPPLAENWPKHKEADAHPGFTRAGKRKQYVETAMAGMQTHDHFRMPRELRATEDWL